MPVNTDLLRIIRNDYGFNRHLYVIKKALFLHRKCEDGYWGVLAPKWLLTIKLHANDPIKFVYQITVKSS